MCIWYIMMSMEDRVSIFYQDSAVIDSGMPVG